MLSSITPVGEMARRQRWWITASAYLVGSVTGGATVGAALAGIGALALSSLSVPVRLALVVAVALAGLAADRRLGGLRLPTWHRQVDERWLTTYRGWVYGLGFGFQLGAALATIVPRSLTYVVLALITASADPTAGLAVGAVFGLTRALPLLATWRVRTPAALTRTHRRLARWAPAADRATTAAQAAFVVAVPLLVLTSGA